MNLRLRALSIFTAAAAIVATSNPTLRQAVSQAFTDTGHSITCAEFNTLATVIHDPGFYAVAYVDLLPASCRAAALSRVHCWKLPNGNYCRNGLEYGKDEQGKGLGGTRACTPDTGTDIPVPCGTSIGPGLLNVMERWDTATDEEKQRIRLRFLNMARGRLQRVVP